MGLNELLVIKVLNQRNELLQIKLLQQPNEFQEEIKMKILSKIDDIIMKVKDETELTIGVKILQIKEKIKKQ